MIAIKIILAMNHSQSQTCTMKRKIVKKILYITDF